MDDTVATILTVVIFYLLITTFIHMACGVDIVDIFLCYFVVSLVVTVFTGIAILLFETTGNTLTLLFMGSISTVGHLILGLMSDLDSPYDEF